MDLRMAAGIALGIGVGIVSGLIGVGGGIVLVPALVFAFKMEQHMAQGTSLAMLLPPTGILAFMRYYRDGRADLKLGLVLALGVFVGGYFGGKWAQAISGPTLRRVFAVILVATAVKLFLQK
ncbi:MAG TPA: TSUP family transporter [Terriglobales bacterium]|nr:TSUP family transporter [Terriglobales bacterium]